MPKEITDIKKFLQLTKVDDKEKDKAAAEKKTGPSSKHQKVLFIKRSKKITKFKLRGKHYLYTFKTSDQTKSNKLIQSLPPTLQRQEVDKEKKAAGKKNK